MYLICSSFALLLWRGVGHGVMVVTRNPSTAHSQRNPTNGVKIHYTRYFCLTARHSDIFLCFVLLTSVFYLDRLHCLHSFWVFFKSISFGSHPYMTVNWEHCPRSSDGVALPSITVVEIRTTKYQISLRLLFKLWNVWEGHVNGR